MRTPRLVVVAKINRSYKVALITALVPVCLTTAESFKLDHKANSSLPDSFSAGSRRSVYACIFIDWDFKLNYRPVHRVATYNKTAKLNLLKGPETPRSPPHSVHILAIYFRGRKTGKITVLYMVGLVKILFIDAAGSGERRNGSDSVVKRSGKLRTQKLYLQEPQAQGFGRLRFRV